jgi:hypothetical protein
MYDMMVLHDDQLGFSVYVHPYWSQPAAVDVRWREGHAKVVLGTWRHLGDSPPQSLLEWLQANEGCLWVSWKAAHPHFD